MPEKEISLAPLPFFNPRRKVLLIIFSGLFILIAVCLWGFFMNPELYGPNYAAKRLSPSLVHLFGTDQLGRDCSIEQSAAFHLVFKSDFFLLY